LGQSINAISQDRLVSGQLDLKEEDKNKKEINYDRKKPIPKDFYLKLQNSLFKLHEIFSIFMIFDAVKSRPVRFTIIFLKILYVLAISGIFTQ
jgi:hypothetical protein